MKKKTIAVSDELHDEMVQMKEDNFKAENVTFEEVIRDLMGDN